MTIACLGMSLLEGSYPIRDEPKGAPGDTCLCNHSRVGELPSSKHTYKGPQVKGDFSRGGNTGSNLSRDKLECYLKWKLIFVVF